jgi:hypothetical protein
MSDFTTTADVKEYLGITVSTSDALIARLITAASAWMINYMSYNPFSATYVDIKNGSGTKSMTFGAYPITGVNSVTVDDVAVDLDYIRYRDATITRTDGYIFPMTSEVSVSFTAGYAAIPAELAQACIEIVCWRFKERDRIGQSMKAEGAHGNVTYQTKDIPASSKTILDQWRRRFPL